MAPGKQEQNRTKFYRFMEEILTAVLNGDRKKGRPFGRPCGGMKITWPGTGR
jgi:hypothetical protein